VLVPIRQHGVITQTNTIRTFTSTKTLKSYIPHCAGNTFQDISWCSTNVSAVLQSCRLLQLNITEAKPAFWYLHWPMCANILINGDDKNEEVMTGIGDRDFKWGDT